MNKVVIGVIVAIIIVIVAIPLLSKYSTSSEPPTEPEMDIWTAASLGEVEIMERHIAFGTDINGTYNIPGVPGAGGSPLHIACLTNQTDVIKLLIKEGADLERKAVAPDPGGGTPLHWAVFALNFNAVEAMLDAGANVNATDKNGATPLNYALIDFATLTPVPATTPPPQRKRIHDFLIKKGATQL